MSDFDAWFASEHPETNALADAQDWAAIGNRYAARTAWNAAIALMRGQSWQSIETAPKDGTSILATEIDGEPVVSYFDEGGWVYSWHAYDGYRHWNPTHWQPLPAPPKDTADEQ